MGVTYWPNIIHPKYHFSPVHRYIKLSTHKIIHEIDDYTRNRRRGYTGEKCYLTRIGLCHRCLRTEPICDLIYSFIAKNYLKQTFYEKKIIILKRLLTLSVPREALPIMYFFKCTIKLQLPVKTVTLCRRPIIPFIKHTCHAHENLLNNRDSFHRQSCDFWNLSNFDQ